jgi:hypothetical protein
MNTHNYNIIYNRTKPYTSFVLFNTNILKNYINKVSVSYELSPRYSNFVPLIISSIKIPNNIFCIYYLCINKQELQYTCKKFATYSGAQYFYNINYKYINNNYDIISVCKFIPNFFHKYVLAYKLNQSFINIQIHN